MMPAIDDAKAAVTALANYRKPSMEKTYGGLLKDYSAWRDLERKALSTLEGAVGALEKKFAAEQRARYAPASADNPQARIAALKDELARLEGRGDGDYSGVARTLGHGVDLPEATFGRGRK